MTLEDAIFKLSTIMKHSSALDEFRHIDLSLVTASERPEYQKAVIFIQNLIDEGELSKDDIMKRLNVK